MIEPPSKAQNTYRCQFGLCLNSLETGLLFGRRKILARSVRQRRRHANAFAQRGVGVDGFADIHDVCAIFNRQRNLANHVARVRADHAAAQDLAGKARADTVLFLTSVHGRNLIYSIQ